MQRATKLIYSSGLPILGKYLWYTSSEEAASMAWQMLLVQNRSAAIKMKAVPSILLSIRTRLNLIICFLLLKMYQMSLCHILFLRLYNRLPRPF